MNYRHAVIVLGAGASKGARVAGGKTPPLDTNFLEIASDYFRGKHARGQNKDKVEAWARFKSHLRRAGIEFSAVKGWRLEQLSIFLEARASLKGLQLGPGRPRNLQKALEALKVLVCHVLQSEGGTRACDLHKKLFELVNPSTVISFNYDLIADQSMIEVGLLDWKSREYRGAKYASIPTEHGTLYRYIQARHKAGCVPLLKLHGSMHWEKLHRGDGFRLAGCRLPDDHNPTFHYLEVPAEPYIVPPVAAKIEIKQAELRSRWRLAIARLHEAPTWIIWGYSFPETDTISHVLFRAALARNRRKKPVLIINPDMSVGARVLEICPKVSVRQYPSMERWLLDNGQLSINNN